MNDKRKTRAFMEPPYDPDSDLERNVVTSEFQVRRSIPGFVIAWLAVTLAVLGLGLATRQLAQHDVEKSLSGIRPGTVIRCTGLQWRHDHSEEERLLLMFELGVDRNGDTEWTGVSNVWWSVYPFRKVSGMLP